MKLFHPLNSYHQHSSLFLIFFFLTQTFMPYLYHPGRKEQEKRLRLAICTNVYAFSLPDGPLPRPLHHQSSSSCPHSHGNAPPPQQPPPQGDYVIPHPVLPFHTPLPSHGPGHSVPPAPPPSLPESPGAGACLCVCQWLTTSMYI